MPSFIYNVIFIFLHRTINFIVSRFLWIFIIYIELIDHQIFHFPDNESMKSRVTHLNQIFIKSPVNVYDFLLLAFYFKRILRMLRTLFHCPWEVRDRRQSREAGSGRSKTSGTSKLYNRFHNSPITLSMRETRLGAFQRSASCLSIVTRTISVVR